MTIWQEPRAFVELGPTPDARVALHAGTVALLAAATDAELAAIRLSPESVVAGIESAGFLVPAGREKLRRVWELARARDFAWTSEIAPMVVPLPAPWRGVVQQVWCLWNEHLKEEALILGRVGTRLDTLLELTGSEATASEAVVLHATLAADIAEGKATAFESWALRIARNPVAGFAADHFTFGIGGFAMERVGSLLGRNLAQVDDWVLDLALRFVLSELVHEALPDRFDVVRESLFTEAQQLGTSTDHTRRVRMLLSAYRSMTGEIDWARPRTPTLVQMRVNDALSVIGVLGVEADLVDPTGEARRMLDKSKWVVLAQHPEPGSTLSGHPVRLAYGRAGERVRELQIQALLREAPPAP